MSGPHSGEGPVYKGQKRGGGSPGCVLSVEAEPVDVAEYRGDTTHDEMWHEHQRRIAAARDEVRRNLRPAEVKQFDAAVLVYEPCPGGCGRTTERLAGSVRKCCSNVCTQKVNRERKAAAEQHLVETLRQEVA